MGVYINGMEMPISCCECKFYHPYRYDTLGIDFCSALSVYMTVDQVFSKQNCPLHEIPEPHGDLIDRDAARGNIKPWSPEDERNGCTFDTVKKLMHTMLDRTPTIIPASEECET